MYILAFPFSVCGVHTVDRALSWRVLFFYMKMFTRKQQMFVYTLKLLNVFTFFREELVAWKATLNGGLTCWTDLT